MKKIFLTTAYVLVLSLIFPAVGFSQLQLQKTATSVSPAILTGENNGEWLRWDDGVNFTGVGKSPGWWTSAILFDIEDLEDYDGWHVTKILVYQYDSVNDGVIKIWQGPDINNLTEYVSQALPMKEHTWHEIVLGNPHIIDASQVLVFGVEWDDFGGGWYPPGLDADSDYPRKGDLASLGTYPEQPWIYLHEVSIYGDWNKAIYIEFEPQETYTVTFEIIDAKTGENIDNAVVTLDHKTNEPGDYVFDNILPGNYEYIVEAEGYLTEEGEVEVIDADVTVEVEMEPEVYTVTFMVKDSETEDPIVNATVTFDGEEYMTDNAGMVMIEDVYPSVYDYTVEKEGYITVEGEAEVEEDTTVDIEMVLETFTVTLIANPGEAGTVDGEGEYFYGEEATITATANEGWKFKNWTDEEENVLTTEPVYSFIVESDRELTANFDIANVITPEKPFYDISLFPNPFTGVVTIKHSRLIGEAVFSIYTVKGSKVFESKISGNSTAFCLSHLQPGVYIYSVRSTAHDTHRGYLIKK